MKKKQHAGYAKNYANLEDLISVYKEFGALYNPKMERLSIKGLSAMRNTVADRMQEHRSSKITEDAHAEKRRQVFDETSALSVRMVNVFAVSGANKKAVADAKSILRRIRGERAGSIPKSAEPPSLITEGETSTASLSNGTTLVSTTISANKSHSVSKQDFDNMSDHFERLVSLVTSNSDFEANEADLNFAALKSQLVKLKTICAAFADARSNSETLRLEQHDLFYLPENGLVDIAKDSKTYVKAVFGANSNEYKRVRKIRFRKF